MKQVENTRPRKNLLWLWIRILLLFALFVVIGLLPALSVIPAVPPLADMQVSDGTISFKPVRGKSDSLTVLKKNNSDREEFSCRVNMQSTHRCIDPRYAGGSARIHWFWVSPTLGGSYKFPAQIVVNGEVVRDRSTAIEHVESTRVFFRFVFAPLVFFGVVACVFFMAVNKGTTTK